MHDKQLIYPGDELFDYHLSMLPPHFNHCCEENKTSFVAEPGSGVLRAVNPVQLREYFYGGEYDERLEDLDEEDDDMEELRYY